MGGTCKWDGCPAGWQVPDRGLDVCNQCQEGPIFHCCVPPVDAGDDASSDAEGDATDAATDSSMDVGADTQPE